jgi:hypothetical protein
MTPARQRIGKNCLKVEIIAEAKVIFLATGINKYVPVGTGE